MRNSKLSAIALFAAAALSVPAHATDAARRVDFKTPGQMVFQEIPSAPPGVRATLLAGDPSRPGPYTIRVFLPAGTVVPPHFHEDDRFVTILSGHWATAAGPVWKDADLVEAPPLSFYVAPARQPKYHVNRSDAVIQISGTGPTRITYVNPSDDPRARK